ncbi:MAG: amino acid transporter [Verrucomicrobiales bacterium]|nr:amino acid transporter [Verrucomicrobiales bacterium]
MEALQSELGAALTGFISGILLTIPVGPVNLTVLNEGARRGLLVALLISAGSVVMDMIYCAIAFTGFAALFTGSVMKASMEVASFVFMLYLGVRFLTSKAVQKVSKVEERIERKLHPHSWFMIGFVRTMGNPGVLLFWIVLAAHFISRGWVQPTLSSKLSCIAGVGTGTSAWFFVLCWAVSRGHGKFTDKTLLRMEHFSGIGLLLLALGQGVHIVFQLVNHTL